MRHDFMDSDSLELLMTVQDDQFQDGAPGLWFHTTTANGPVLDAHDVARLHEITKSWLQRHTGAIL